MDRDNDNPSPELIELGTASGDTQGNEGLVPEGGAFWPRTGISDE